jgi:hypothetical protein
MWRKFYVEKVREMIEKESEEAEKVKKGKGNASSIRKPHIPRH